MTTPLFWLVLNIITILISAFYSMMEMACVSFNKVRLNYYVQKDMKRAIWLNWLLHHPFRLFGTTLIGVNLTLVIGSECSRQFYTSIGLNPNLAPITQVALVVVFGELAPMFAARHYAENVAMLGSFILWLSAKILYPALIVVGWITNFTAFIFGIEKKKNLFINLEELKKILEEQSDEITSPESHNFNVITDNIFLLRHKTASDAITPLNYFPSIPSNATIAHMKKIIKQKNAHIATIYYKNYSNIVGIVSPRDLLRAPSETKRARDFAKSPWFVTKTTKLTSILEQFKRNNENVAVILDFNGKAIGLITLDDLLDEIFGEAKYVGKREKSKFILERTFPGEMLVKEFNEEFNVILDKDTNLSLSDLMKKNLGHFPEEGESIYIKPFELTAVETSLLEVKRLMVKTK